MKKILNILFVLIFIFILLVYRFIIPFNKSLLQTMLFSFVPSLLPCLFITQWLINISALDDLYLILKKSKITKFIYSLILIIIIITLGLPSSYYLLLDQKEKGIIKAKSFNSALISLGPISFPFLYTICLNIDKGYIILAIHYLITISSLIYQSFIIETTNLNINDISYVKAFKKSVNKTLSTLSLIVIIVFIFSLPLFILEKISSPYKYFIEGLIEFSYPCYNASLTNNYLVILFISLFPSLTIILQTKMIYSEFKIKNYLFYRLILSISGVFIYYLLF